MTTPVQSYWMDAFEWERLREGLESLAHVGSAASGLITVLEVIDALGDGPACDLCGSQVTRLNGYVVGSLHTALDALGSTASAEAECLLAMLDKHEVGRG